MDYLVNRLNINLDGRLEETTIFIEDADQLIKATNGIINRKKWKIVHKSNNKSMNILKPTTL